MGEGNMGDAQEGLDRSLAVDAEPLGKGMAPRREPQAR
jgi:hypothetical protein